MTSTKYCDMPGVKTCILSLKSNKAIDFAISISNQAFYYATFVKSLSSKETEADYIIIDLKLDLPQNRVFDVRDEERIACTFNWNDDIIPRVFVLREDFPQTPHMLLLNFDYPKCICIYEDNYDDLKISWNIPDFINRIANWFVKTSTNSLHLADQPLEPLLPNPINNLILPDEQIDNVLQYVVKSSENGILSYLPIKKKDININGKYYWATIYKGMPTVHGIITRMPYNLYDLIEFTSRAKIDLAKELKEACIQFSDLNPLPQKYSEVEIIVILVLPKSRIEGGVEESHDILSFHINASLLKLGKALGIWEDNGKGIPGRYIPARTIEKPGESIEVVPLGIHNAFNKGFAEHINGYKTKMDFEAVLIGCGALGSSILNNFIRSGFGNWIVIDSDIFLPHNLARHILKNTDIGTNKALATSTALNNIQVDNDIQGIPADILKPGRFAEQINKSLEEADIIIDASTSIAVERHLAFNVKSDARRLSVFFNPSGNDLVFLIEDSKRKLTLDFIEIQYYRYIVHEKRLENHIKQEIDKVRYASSCRDLSNVIPIENINILSSICSAFLHEVLNKQEASINIWHINSETLSVQNFETDVSNPISIDSIKGWRLITDDHLLKIIHKYRSSKLPNETGGILLGSYDMLRKIVYVVDTILSPSDSKEWPSSYVRGNHGLVREIQRFSEITQNKLEYVGEWHSHPKGYGCMPSNDDMIFMRWITNYMGQDGHPGLMLICSESDQRFLLDI